MSVDTGNNANDDNHPNPNLGQPPACDRRISRAARHILIHDTLPILQHHHPEHTHRCHHATTTSVTVTVNGSRKPHLKRQLQDMNATLDLYATLLTDLVVTPETCPLVPGRDVLWDDERNYTARASQYASRRKGSASGNDWRQLNTCWVCGRSFVSRYYLDRHLQGHRRDGAAAAGGEICPAEDLCYYLGEENCRRRALVEEPWYARGHPEDLATRRSHRRSHWRDAAAVEACDGEEMARRRDDCRRAFGYGCFGGGNDGLVRDITAVLCDGTWSCRDRREDVHRQVRDGGDDGGFGRRGVHFRREEWFRCHDEVMVSPFLVVLLLSVYAMYYLCVYGTEGFRRERQREHID